MTRRKEEGKEAVKVKVDPSADALDTPPRANIIKTMSNDKWLISNTTGVLLSLGERYHKRKEGRRAESELVSG